MQLPFSAYKKAGERLFPRAHRDRTRNGFRLKEGGFKLEYCEDGEPLGQVAQRSWVVDAPYFECSRPG